MPRGCCLRSAHWCLCVHLEDPAGCAERCAGLCAGGEHPPLRLDGSVVCGAVLPHLHCGTDVLHLSAFRGATNLRLAVSDALARIDSVLEAAPMQVQAISQHPQDASVTLQDVHFSYDGKTTVSRLAARFWDYQKGSITVGGMDVSRIDPEKLMSLYSIVFQDVTLFKTRSWKTSVWGAKVPPVRRSLRQQSWQAAKNLLRNRRYIGELRLRDVVQPNAIPALVSGELVGARPLHLATQDRSVA